MADLADQFAAADARLPMGKVSEFGEGVDAPEECKELLGQIAKETEAAGKAMRKPAEEPPRVPLPGMAGYAEQLEAAVGKQDL